MDRAGTIDRGKSLIDPASTGVTRADVYFNNNSGALATTVDANTTVRSLNFASGATGAVSIGGTGALTIGAGGITVQQGTGTHTLSANVTLGADQTWGNVSDNNFTVSGNIGGSGNLTITGSYTIQTAGDFTPGAGGDTSLENVATNTSTYTGTGTVTLGGNNTYTGTTTVSNGTLIVNGNISTSSLTTVASGGTLGGSGTVGTTTILSGGAFAPGTSPGTMTFTGDLGLNLGSAADFEINAFTSGNFDLAVAAAAGTQTVSFNGGILNLLFQPGFNATGSAKIFDFDLYAGSGFTSVTSSGLASGYEASFDYTTGIVTVIPEPRAALIGGLGLLVLLRRKRR
jgi:autotransporter-associated beta strand protein